MFSDKTIWGCWYFSLAIFRSVKRRGNTSRAFKWGTGPVPSPSEGNSENFKDQRDPKTRDHQNFHRYLFVCYFAGNGDDSNKNISM